jgi:hypothetical protein
VSEAPLRSPVEEEHGEGMLEASPLSSQSPSREESDLGFSFPTSRVADGSPGEGSGSIPLVDNQTVPWADPGHFDPWIVHPGNTSGTPGESLQPNKPLAGPSPAPPAWVRCWAGPLTQRELGFFFFFVWFFFYGFFVLLFSSVFSFSFLFFFF